MKTETFKNADAVFDRFNSCTPCVPMFLYNAQVKVPRQHTHEGLGPGGEVGGTPIYNL